jgi:zinc protease
MCVPMAKSTNNLDIKKYHGSNMQKRLQKPVVEKKILSNGMTILVHTVTTIPKVSLQLWYNVGSKDEKTGEKGLAHLIEHMIFKGTKSLLSESDINVLTHKLSGSCNAFTWYDYTGYLFNMPSHNWEKVLPIVSDCMVNCLFKDDHLNSEMKAVIQELKMRRDEYAILLIEDLLTSIFADHPYHYPVIGYKQDLWSVSAANLQAFYKKHYIPSNATLVVVGDVLAEHVFDLAELHFGSIKSPADYTRQRFYHNRDIVSKQVTLYRDIQQPMIANVFVVPGFYEKIDHVIDTAALLLGGSKASRLYRRLVDELQLVTSIDVSSWDLFEYGLLIISFEPKQTKDINAIEAIIQEEIDSLATEGPRDDELERVVKRLQIQYYRFLEDTEQQAHKIGESFLATGDENYAFNYLIDPTDILKHKVKNLLKLYIRPCVMHRGSLLPLPEQEKKYWAILQQQSDQEDERILLQRQRITEVEPARYAHTIESAQPKQFHFPRAHKTTLSNGVKVLYYNNNKTPKIDLILDLKSKYYYDSEIKPGLYNFVTHMLTEGTTRYNATQLAQEFEKLGISFSAYPGQIRMSMLSVDLKRGLELLGEILLNSTFDLQQIEKVRSQILADISNFWDDPYYFAGQLLREAIYHGHPYSKNQLGQEKSIRSITRDDLVEFYNSYISPDGAKIVLVGDIDHIDLQKELDSTIGKWLGSQIAEVKLPKLYATQKKEINYSINRDQITLCFAGLSVERLHPDYDKLLIFDQILTGGLLGSMSSRLFELREQTGLFYTISGSLIANANYAPGMFIIKTIVSLDRLKEAEEVILKTLKHSTDVISNEEFEHAKNAIANVLIDNFESSSEIAQAFLFLDKYNLPANYFDMRMEALQKISISDVQLAVKKVICLDQLLTIRVGRVSDT